MKKTIAVLLAVLLSAGIFCGCEDEVIEMPTIVIDDTIGQDSSSDINLGIDIDEDDENVDSEIGDVYEDVDLSDPNVIVGKWEIVSHLVDDVEETSETKYLVITEDYKFYLTNSLTSLSGDYRYTYEDAVITVTLNNQLDEAYAVTMDNEDTLTLKYGASAKVYTDTYTKVK